MRVLAAATVFSGLVGKSLAQTGADSNPPQAVLRSIAKPLYPPLARQTSISGNVELSLEVGKDGKVESARVVSGHPLLVQAALDSAQESQFECGKCTETVIFVRLIFTFQLVGSGCTTAKGSPDTVQLDEPLPRMIQSQNHVTLIDRPGFCDPGVVSKRVRSLKCLYLWKCANSW